MGACSSCATAEHAQTSHTDQASQLQQTDSADDASTHRKLIALLTAAWLQPANRPPERLTIALRRCGSGECCACVRASRVCAAVGNICSKHSGRGASSGGE